jgi:hypothetical protein
LPNIFFPSGQQEGLSIYWGGEVVDKISIGVMMYKHWSHDVSYQKLNEAILAMGLQPPNFSYLPLPVQNYPFGKRTSEVEKENFH